MTLVESHNLTKLYDRDFHKISNNAYPVVFAYNGRDHFAPTIPATAEQFTQWKVQSELGNLLAASLHVCAQLDQQQLPPQICSAVKEVQTAIARNLPTISKAGQVQFKELQRYQISTHRGPAIQPPTPAVPLPSAEQDPPSAQPVPSTSGASQQATDEPEVGRKGFKCHVCGERKFRKPDFEGHMWSKYRLGNPIVCNRGDCGGKSYSSISSLRQHIRTIHKGQYRFNCDKCDYGTDNQDCLMSHRVTKHKAKYVNTKGKRVVHECSKCKKIFSGPHLLRKHISNKSCTKKKTVPCPECGKMYKTKESMQYHLDQQHKGKSSPCPTCGKLVSEKAMKNHMKRHSSQRALQRAKDFVAKAKRRKIAFAFSSKVLERRKIAARKKSASSRSAPAKLRKGKSPRRQK